MKKFLKPATLFPILTGAVAGVLLFIFGYSEDAPGMCLIGISVAFVLMMWGVNNAGVIKKGLFAPILLFCFGAGGVILSIVLLLQSRNMIGDWQEAYMDRLGKKYIELLSEDANPSDKFWSLDKFV